MISNQFNTNSYNFNRGDTVKKDLPRVFANKIEKEVLNNKNYSYSKNEEESLIRKTNSPKVNINQKINNIFSSPKYVYKAVVDIKTNNGILKKQIVGKNDGNLITIDNEVIPISSIIDIDFSE